MSKKPFAYIKTIDELSFLSEEELSDRAQFLYDEMHSKRVMVGTTEAIPWEIELAYIQREQEIRRHRKLKHKEYMEQLHGEEAEKCKFATDEFDGRSGELEQ